MGMKRKRMKKKLPTNRVPNAQIRVYDSLSKLVNQRKLEGT
jgi:hypothetical protein